MTVLSRLLIRASVFYILSRKLKVGLATSQVRKYASNTSIEYIHLSHQKRSPFCCHFEFEKEALFLHERALGIFNSWEGITNTRLQPICRLVEGK